MPELPRLNRLSEGLIVSDPRLRMLVHDGIFNRDALDRRIPESGKQIGLQSDRLFAEWHLESDKVVALAAGEKYIVAGEPEAEVEIVNDWSTLVESDPAAALELQLRVRRDFEAAFAAGLVGRSFRRDADRPAYLLYRG